MLYPRMIGNELVSFDQVVGTSEHLLKEHRILFVTGTILSDMERVSLGISGETVSNTLLALDSLSHDPIKLVISSGGGSLDGLLLMYDTIRLISSPVETLGRFCASAAALLLACGSKRYLLPSSKVMLHLPSGTMMGDTRDIEIQQKQVLIYRDEMVELLQSHGVRLSKERILADIDRELWLPPEEAIQYGLADEIMTKAHLAKWLAPRSGDMVE